MKSIAGGGIAGFFGRTALVLAFLAAPSLQGATINARSAAQADVAAAIASAAAGDTVVVPAGSVSWGSGITVSKPISIKGAGIGSTVVTAGYSDAYGTGLIAYAPSAADVTKVFELSGFTFDGKYQCGCFSARPPGSTTPITGLKIHDNKFLNGYSRAIVLSGLEFGVFYKNQFQDNYIGISVIGSEQSGWKYPVTQGGPNYPFFEDNTFVQTIARGGFIVETGRGGRIVFRHNTITGYGGAGGEVWDAHGVNGVYPTDNGTVSIEYYDNSIQLSSSTRILNHRGGMAMVFNNTVTGGSGYFSMTEYQGWSYCTSAGYPKPEQVNNSYYWNNTSGGSAMNPNLTCTSGSCSSCGQYDSMYIQLNRDYWLPTSGKDASKPASCTASGLYGSTDTDVLYQCNSGGSWGVKYTPYTYPHPLTSGSTGGGGSVNPAISVTPNSLDFGVVAVGSTTNLNLTVQNVGGGVLSGACSVPPPFSIVSGGSYSLGSNQSQVVRVSFSPKATGATNQTISFTGGGGASALAAGSSPLGLSFPSVAGLITAPFAITPNATVSQTVETTDPTQGGEAVYFFTVLTPGNYTVSANVLAPADASNSIFVNIDGEPTSPGMIWDIPISTARQNEVVSWRGTGTDSADAISPQVWNLSAGIHELIFRGREAGVEVGNISVSPYQASPVPPAPPNFRITALQP